MHKCLRSQEPVLLVGETGCGKTTLCQVFAALNRQQLFSINCHQNTETSDFIGCMRTRKNLQQTQDELDQKLQELLQSPLLAGLSQEQKLHIQKHKNTKKQADALIKILKPLCKEQPELRESFKTLKQLRAELNMVFEWHDGILVEAMQAGGLLLIDEISLANDSVLERLNSVFESERLLVLSEKSSQEAIKVMARDGFNIVATMNPSGDFGKKELSPALRNRMTEIWVESYFLQKLLLELYPAAKSHQHDQPALVHRNIDHNVDLYLVTLKMCEDKIKSLSAESVKKVAVALFNMIGFVNFTLARKHQALQRKALSIRDIINAIEFIRVSLPLFDFCLPEAIYHAIQLVIMDGLCLGIDVAGPRQKEMIVRHCEKYIDRLLSEVCPDDGWTSAQSRQLELVNTDHEIGVKPFLLKKLGCPQPCHFAFDAGTTESNLHRLLRAYQLQKPMLIEGPPGVGKTSLVENLARVSGRTLIRVNLSEQTDMMDLLGSEYPTVAGEVTEGQEDDIQFRWCDGALLRAIKEGHWFLIDEMNLAQQSVLEGLNAILDHRRVVYIPELNREFQCHPDFFVFACQNPSQSGTSVGGRKTLPKSFMNRFNKIYLEELTTADYQCILERQVEKDDLLKHLDIAKVLSLSQELEAAIKASPANGALSSDEGAVNLRDLNRLFKLYRRFMADTAGDHDLSLLHAVEICYLQKLGGEQRYDVSLKLLTASGLLSHSARIAEVLQCGSQVRCGSDHSLCFKAKK